MRWMYAAALFLFLLPLQNAVAAQDDNDADLKDTPEELARLAVLKRWPDAQNIDAFDEADEDEEVADDKDDDGRQEDKLPEQMLPENDVSDWTVSVTFTSAGKEFEVLANDDGVVRYVYEEVPVEDAPVEVLKGAREAVKKGDILYVDKIQNEHRNPAVTTFVVGMGDKDVYLDEKGKELKVIDVPDDDPVEEGPAAMDGAL